VGTFSGSNPYTCRDYAALPDAPAPGWVEVTGLDISVETGDAWGNYYSDGGLQYNGTGTANTRCYKSGSHFADGEQTYSAQAGYACVTYGTGATASAGGGSLVGVSSLVGGRILCGNGNLIN
jgi:hypothetical protein